MPLRCMKCGTNTPDVGAHPVTLSNGRHAIKATCARCGTKKFQFVSAPGGSSSRKASSRKRKAPSRKRVRRGKGVGQDILGGILGAVGQIAGSTGNPYGMAGAVGANTLGNVVRGIGNW